MSRNRQTPIERLQAEKLQVGIRCREQEEKLNGHWEYIRDHSGSLLLSGIVTLFFPSHRSETSRTSTDNSEASGSALKSMLPIIWSMVKPIVISWLLAKAGDLIRNIFTKEDSPEE